MTYFVLTKEQEDKQEAYIQLGYEVSHDSSPADFEKLKHAMSRVYEMAGFRVPPMYLVDSPRAACMLAAKLDFPDASEEELEDKHYDYYSDFMYGRQWSSWYIRQLYCVEVLGEKIDERTEHFLTIARESGWYSTYEEAVIFQESPIEIYQDAEYRMHREDGPCMVWRDGFGVYAINGISLSEKIVMRPHELTVQEITDEKNAELRRIMMQRYGMDKFLKESGATVISQDERGTLYEFELQGQKVRNVVVENKTPEPDGSIKIYTLGARPTDSSPQQAVAATFGLEAGDYDPAFET